jgi:hypothetical protein
MRSMDRVSVIARPKQNRPRSFWGTMHGFRFTVSEGDSETWPSLTTAVNRWSMFHNQIILRPIKYRTSGTATGIVPHFGGLGECQVIPERSLNSRKSTAKHSGGRKAHGIRYTFNQKNELPYAHDVPVPRTWESELIA